MHLVIVCVHWNYLLFRWPRCEEYCILRVAILKFKMAASYHDDGDRYMLSFMCQSSWFCHILHQLRLKSSGQAEWWWNCYPLTPNLNTFVSPPILSFHDVTEQICLNSNSVWGIVLCRNIKLCHTWFYMVPWSQCCHCAWFSGRGTASWTLLPVDRWVHCPSTWLARRLLASHCSASRQYGHFFLRTLPTTTSYF